MPGDINLDVEETGQANATDNSDAPALEVASESSKARHDARQDRIATASISTFSERGIHLSQTMAVIVGTTPEIHSSNTV